MHGTFLPFILLVSLHHFVIGSCSRVSTGIPSGTQAAMLPEMVAKLGVCVAMGRTTYVHCTAGINRAKYELVY